MVAEPPALRRTAVGKSFQVVARAFELLCRKAAVVLVDDDPGESFAEASLELVKHALVVVRDDEEAETVESWWDREGP